VALVAPGHPARTAACRQTPADTWLNVILSALAHDLGYLRGICRADTGHRFVAGEDGAMIEFAARRLGRGTRAMARRPLQDLRARALRLQSLIDPERLARNIELTRFPVPDDDDHKATDTEAAFVRAADLIGQLGDPLYPRKLNALFHEFEEIGINKVLGYATPADVTDRYPAFSGRRSSRSWAKRSMRSA